MTAPAELTLTGGRIVTPGGVLEDGWVHLTGSVITAVGTGEPPRTARHELGGRWVVPGFVDIHCHGGGGASFGSTDPEQAHAAARTHLAHGTTTMLASLVSAPVDELAAQAAMLHELVGDGVLAGIHLEGPFLSAARCGAHDRTALRPPGEEAVGTLLAAGGGDVRMVTLAPELEDAVPAVRRLTAEGVITAIGHTDASHEQVLPALDAGATVATHLFNGMRPLHHREPGAAGALLDDERVTVELICDLVHLHPTTARLAARHAGPARTVAITDAVGATAAGDGRYELGGLPVTVTGGEPRLDDGSLAGSTLTMDAALRNLVHGCGLSITEAVSACSTHPARLLGLSERLGAVRSGLAADLVVLDEELRPQRVMRRGSWLRRHRETVERHPRWLVL